MNSSRRVLWGFAALAIIIASGVAGYMTIEGWNLLDSLYMTITTITSSIIIAVVIITTIITTITTIINFFYSIFRFSPIPPIVPEFFPYFLFSGDRFLWWVEIGDGDVEAEQA